MRSVGRERREEQACEARGGSLFDCADLSVRAPPGRETLGPLADVWESRPIHTECL